MKGESTKRRAALEGPIFETSPKQVKYQLGFIPSDGAWKLSGVTIDIE
jgi:hypothetical protein